MLSSAHFDLIYIEVKNHATVGLFRQSLFFYIHYDHPRGSPHSTLLRRWGWILRRRGWPWRCCRRQPSLQVVDSLFAGKFKLFYSAIDRLFVVLSTGISHKV